MKIISKFYLILLIGYTHGTTVNNIIYYGYTCGYILSGSTQTPNTCTGSVIAAFKAYKLTPYVVVTAPPYCLTCRYLPRYKKNMLKKMFLPESWMYISFYIPLLSTHDTGNISVALIQYVVVYPGGGNVNLGNQLSVLQVALQPMVTWSADPNTMYTLVMIDPDLPYAQLPSTTLLHWLVVNIFGSNVNGGNTLAIYESPTPAPLSLPHRFTLLVYAQSHYIDVIPLENALRVGFDVNQYAADNNLCGPICGNFYLAAST